MSETPIESLRKRLGGVICREAITTDPLVPPPSGSLVEWCGLAGAGSATLSQRVAAQVLSSRSGLWVIVDPAGEFSSMPVWGWGIPLERVLIVRPRRVGEFEWSVEHSLRSPAVAVTWCWTEARHDRLLRRWKRAVETSGGIGVLFRSVERSTGTGIDARWRCKGVPAAANQGRTIRVQLDYSRNFQGGTSDAQVHDAEGSLSVVSSLANPKGSARAAGA